MDVQDRFEAEKLDRQKRDSLSFILKICGLIIMSISVIIIIIYIAIHSYFNALIDIFVGGIVVTYFHKQIANAIYDLIGDMKWQTQQRQSRK